MGDVLHQIWNADLESTLLLFIRVYWLFHFTRFSHNHVNMLKMLVRDESVIIGAISVTGNGDKATP